jgi:hypothetical protein
MSRLLKYVLAVLLIIFAASNAYSSSETSKGKYFTTLPPLASLPSDSQCAASIPPIPEQIKENTPFNYTVPTASQLAQFHRNPASGVTPVPSEFSRVDGDYTGSTEMILRWTACKWGIDENLVRAQAWAESKWVQGGPDPAAGGGDKRTRLEQCVQGNFAALWDFACKNCCYQSWGILQTKVYYAPGTWPMIKDSTAFNADYRYAEERACLNGEYLNYFASDAQQPNSYAADVRSGDLNRLLWGCTGMHFSGSWYDPSAVEYIGEIRQALKNAPWTSR